MTTQGNCGAVCSGGGLPLSRGSEVSLPRVPGHHFYRLSSRLCERLLTLKVVFQYPTNAAPSPAGVPRYSKASRAWVGETIAKATTARQAISIDPCLGRILPPYSCPQTIYQRLEAFDNILPDLSLNDSGRIAFTGLGVDDLGGARYGLDRTEGNAFQAGKNMFATN